MLTLWNSLSRAPHSGLFPLEREWNQLWSQFPFSSQRSVSLSAPAADISETDKHVTIKLDLPGHQAEDIQVGVKDGVLTVRSERQLEQEEEGKTFHRRELRYGAHTRSFTLSEDVNGDGISARYHNGVLTLTLPKQEKSEPKQIEVQVASEG